MLNKKSPHSAQHIDPHAFGENEESDQQLDDDDNADDIVNRGDSITNNAKHNRIILLGISTALELLNVRKECYLSKQGGTKETLQNKVKSCIVNISYCNSRT